MNKAIFLDRDGVLIFDPGHLAAREQVCLLAGVEALRRLTGRGYYLVIISNQSVVGRGLMTEKDMWDIDAHVRQLLEKKEVTIRASYYCPHYPPVSGVCECRKPQPGLFIRAIQDLGIDPAQSVVIGDKPTDLEAGSAAGIPFGIVVKRNQRQWEATADELKRLKHKAVGIGQAVRLIERTYV